jgi:hypothetical protein
MALKNAEELYQQSQENKMPLFTLDALARKENIFYSQARLEDFYEIDEHHENLFNSIPQEES